MEFHTIFSHDSCTCVDVVERREYIDQRRTLTHYFEPLLRHGDPWPTYLPETGPPALSPAGTCCTRQAIIRHNIGAYLVAHNSSSRTNTNAFVRYFCLSSGCGYVSNAEGVGVVMSAAVASLYSACHAQSRRITYG